MKEGSTTHIVYIHRSKETGEVFYVGTGEHELRAYTYTGRSNAWMARAFVEGTTVEIVDRNLSMSDAYELEMFLIEVIGRSKLVNKTDGGPGVKGYRKYNRTTVKETWIEEYNLNNPEQSF